jgi:hypothetical protein
MKGGIDLKLGMTSAVNFPEKQNGDPFIKVEKHLQYNLIFILTFWNFLSSIKLQLDLQLLPG